MTCAPARFRPSSTARPTSSKTPTGPPAADQTPTGRAEDIGGVVTLTYTGDHLYTGSVSILAGRLVVRGNLPSSILIVRGGVHDLRGRRESYRGVRLISGSIIDSGRDGESGARVKGSLTVNADDRSGGSYGEFDLRSGTVSATLTGSGALVKRTDGTTAATSTNPGGIVTLSGNNSYSGQTTVEAGILRVTHANALGTPAPVGGVTPDDQHHGPKRRDPATRGRHGQHQLLQPRDTDSERPGRGRHLYSHTVDHYRPWARCTTSAATTPGMARSTSAPPPRSTPRPPLSSQSLLPDRGRFTP